MSRDPDAAALARMLACSRRWKTEPVKARRQNAPKLALPPGLQLPKEGLTELLVEPGPNGSWSILGHRRAPAGAVTSSSPVSARLIKPAEGRRG